MHYNAVLTLLCIGPAGTGKTESVKALGNQLGRFVLVFNCDEKFDFQVFSSSLKSLDVFTFVFLGNGKDIHWFVSGRCLGLL